MRVIAEAGTKGSQKWLQVAVEQNPSVLETHGLSGLVWRSPLREDDFAEYRDATFLQCIGLAEYAHALSEFWPRSGPQWDGLATSGERVVLVEAKSHIREFMSPPSAATPASFEKISSALRATAGYLGAKHPEHWPILYYQYANRLAHLYFLRRNGVDAHLLFVSFVGDEEMQGPIDKREWHTAFQCAAYALGLSSRHKLSKFVHHVNPDVRQLRAQLG